MPNTSIDLQLAAAPGSKVQIWTCGTPTEQQLWTPLPPADGSLLVGYQLSGTDLCLDLTDGSLENGKQLQVWTCTGGPNQVRFSCLCFLLHNSFLVSLQLWLPVQPIE